MPAVKHQLRARGSRYKISMTWPDGLKTARIRTIFLKSVLWMDCSENDGR